VKIPLLILAFFAGLVTGCVSPASGIKSDPVTALRQLNQERIQAQIGADAAALDRLYAEDFIGIGPSGTVRTKAQVIADFTSGAKATASPSRSNTRISGSSCASPIPTA
jgi:hypothetical protein